MLSSTEFVASTNCSPGCLSEDDIEHPDVIAQNVSTSKRINVLNQPLNDLIEIPRVENTRPTGNSESLDLGGDFRDFSDISLTQFLTLTYDQTIDQCKKIIHEIRTGEDANILKKLHFLTVNPSPEFMYLKYRNLISDLKSQLLFFEQLFRFVAQQTGTTILSISAEKGKNPGPIPILHYHLLLQHASTRKFKKFYTAIRNQVTVLHEIKGFQSALKESEVQSNNLYEGIKYFNGVNHKTDSSLKPDYYMTYPFHGLAEPSNEVRQS